MGGALGFAVYKQASIADSWGNFERADDGPAGDAGMVNTQF